MGWDGVGSEGVGNKVEKNFDGGCFWQFLSLMQIHNFYQRTHQDSFVNCASDYKSIIGDGSGLHTFESCTRPSPTNI